MSATVWITIAGLCAGTAAIKGFGPLVFGARRPHPVIARVIPMLAPALLAALVVAETFAGPGRTLALDARVGGLAAAGIALWRRAPLTVVVLSAAVVTALLRTLS